MEMLSHSIAEEVTMRKDGGKEMKEMEENEEIGVIG